VKKSGVIGEENEGLVDGVTCATYGVIIVGSLGTHSFLFPVLKGLVRAQL